MVLVAGMRWADATQQRAAPAHHPRHSHYFAKAS